MSSPEVRNTAEVTLEDLQEFVTAVVAWVIGSYAFPQLFQLSWEKSYDSASYYVGLPSY